MDFKEYILNAEPSNIDAPFIQLKDSSRKKTTEFPPKFSRNELIPPVMNQGKIGSCVGCSGYIVAHDAKVVKDDYPSALWIYHNAKRYDAFNGENYSGTSINGACDSLVADGCCSKTQIPYVETEVFEFTKEALSWANNNKLLKYGKIDINDITTIKTFLQEGSLWLSFNVSSSFYDRKVTQEGIVLLENYDTSKYLGGHAVAIIGWEEINGKLFWECRNSWGEFFGKNGNFLIEHELLIQIIHNNATYYCSNTPENIIKEETTTTKKNRNFFVKFLARIRKLIFRE
jgi:C1A family cysteine protease